MGVLTVVDADSVADYCEDVCIAQKMKRICDKEGWYTESGRRSGPAMAYNDARKRMLDFRSRYGLTAADRARVSTLPEPPQTKEQEWRELLG